MKARYWLCLALKRAGARVCLELQPPALRSRFCQNEIAVSTLAWMDQDKSRPVILVVGGEVLLRKNAIDRLEDEGYRVVEAANANAAIDILMKRSDVQLHFTDIQMPGALDGLDLVQDGHRRWL